MTFGLKNNLVFDRFSGRFLKTDFMPWDFSKTQKVSDWDDKDDDCLVNYIERKYEKLRVPQIVKASLSELAKKRSTNLVTDYFKSLKWDGVPRLDNLLIDYFGTEDTVYAKEIIRKKLVSIVRRVITEMPVKSDEMIILTGAQGIGKSTFLSKLGKEWYNDGITDFNNKDTLIIMQKCLIIEIGELQAFNKTDVNRLKQFLGQTVDSFRAPYDSRSIDHPRHCAFFGTTNDNEFLKDPTGERRFWPIECLEQNPTKSVFKDLTEYAVDQIWAEAVVVNAQGESLELSKEADELAKMHQGLHKEVHPWEGAIKEFILQKVSDDWLEKSGSEFNDFNNLDTDNLIDRDRICAAIVWCECLGNPLKYMKQSDTRLINGILSNLKFDDRKLTRKRMYFGKKYGTQRGFEIVTL